MTSASAARVERPAKELGVAHVRARPHGLALELIDLLVDPLQRRGIARAVVPAAGRLGDVVQQRLVDADDPVLVAKAEQPTAHRHRRHAFAADADRVDLDAEHRRRLCRGTRIDRAAVVLAVGEQDHHPRSARRVAQPVGRRGDRGADRGAVLELAGRKIVDGGVDDRIIRRQRNLRQRLGGERDDADAIARARADEAS